MQHRTVEIGIARQKAGIAKAGRLFKLAVFERDSPLFLIPCNEGGLLKIGEPAELRRVEKSIPAEMRRDKVGLPMKLGKGEGG
ncbi:MAG: hypothetical protein O3A08_12310 [Proteobacteria bacterium]|nr:hypothetical protein [Pseudomonadota bacterium]MDA1287178.1 hypothetical protein [Pseudomonadota bacterium]